MDLLDYEEIKLLSERSHLFSAIGVGKDALKRDIKGLVTRIIQNKKLPYLIELSEFVLSYMPYFPAQELAKIFQLIDICLKALDGRDFRVFAPLLKAICCLRFLVHFKKLPFHIHHLIWSTHFESLLELPHDRIATSRLYLELSSCLEFILQRRLLLLPWSRSCRLCRLGSKICGH